MLTSLLLFCIFIFQAVALANAPVVIKAEPPSWWAGHTINPVRLLVRGQNLAGAHVRATTRLLQPSRVLVNSAETYLFVDLNINPRTPPGTYSLIIETAHGRTEVPFTIERPLAARTNFQGVTVDDVIYLIMIDRFANGDESNDTPRDAPAEANDRRNPRAFHGGDLRGVINHLPYMKELGITTLWLTPWHDNWNGINTCDKSWCPNTYYHGYHSIDYYAVEDRFGDITTLRELVEKAHRLGLKVVQDQVANHVGSRHPWARNPPLPDWFHGTLAQHDQNRFANSVLLSPHANQDDLRNVLEGWFSDDLPDMNQEQPEVARYEIQNALWWIGVSGIDGIRQDTIQYMPRPFIRDLSNALHRQYQRMWMVGEVFERDAAQTAFFMGGHTGWDGVDTKLDSVFDFSLWDVSLKVFTGKLPVKALRDQLKYDALYPDVTKITTLVNNHDTPRFMSLPGATLEGAMLHTAFTLSVRGIPQLYAGEEIAMEGKEDPENRRDFPGGFPADQRSAFNALGRTSIEKRMFDWTRSWISLRADHPALRHGRLIDLFYDEESYAFARQIPDQTVIVILNRADHDRTVVLPAAAIGLRNGTELQPLLGAKDRSRVVSGRASLVVPAKTAAAYGLRINK